MYDYDKAIDGCVEPVLMALALGATRAALELPPREDEEESEESEKS